MKAHTFSQKPTKSRFLNFHNILHNLFTLLLLFLTIFTCLDLTATITRSTPLPILRGKLVDNGKFVCGINLSTKFGSRLPWNCLPGYKAWSTPDGGQLVYTNEGGQKFDLKDIQKKWQGDAVTHDNQMTVLRGKWFGCRLEDPWTPTPKFKRSRIWTERHGEVDEGETTETSIRALVAAPDAEFMPAEAGRL